MHTRDVDIVIDYLARIAVAVEKLSEQIEAQVQKSDFIAKCGAGKPDFSNMFNYKIETKVER